MSDGSWANKYVGLIYVRGGRSLDGGFDCWGLYSHVQRVEFKREIPEYDGPEWRPGASLPEIARAARAFSRRWTSIDISEAVEGDAILFNLLGQPIHVATIVSPGQMLHIREGCDAVVETYNSPWWDRRVTGFYRYGKK